MSRDPNQICLTLQSELLTKWNCQSLKLLIFKTDVFSLVFFYAYDLICVKLGPELIYCFALYSFKLYVFQTHDLWCLHDIPTYESSTNLTILNFHGEKKKCCDFLLIIVEWISGFSLGQVTDTTAMVIDKGLDPYIP